MAKLTPETKECFGRLVTKTLWEVCCGDQTKPDGLSCAICGDNGHQGFECQWNGMLNFIKELRQ